MSTLHDGSHRTAPLHVTRGAERQQLRWAGRTVFDVVLGGERTGGAFALLDQWGERGDVTPVHVHRVEAELFYLLDGGITAWAGEDVLDLEAGDAVYLPPGQPHAFGVRTPQARLITVTAPGGFSAFVEAAGQPFDGDRTARWEFDLGRLLGAAGEHGIDIVGPPPALPPA